MRYLSSFIRPYSKMIALSCSFKAVGGIVDIILPILLSVAIEAGISTNNFQLVIKYGVLMVGLTIISIIGNALCSYHAAHTAETIGNNIRKALYQHKQALSIRDLQEYTYSGLTTRVVYDVDTISRFLVMCMRMVVRNSILAVGGVIVACTLDLYATLILLVSMGIMICISRFLLTYTGIWFRRVSEGIDTSSAIIREAITGIRTIKSFAKQSREQEKFQDKIEDIYTAQVTANTATSILGPCVTVISNVTLAVILLVSGFRVEDAALDPIKLTTFVVYINMFVQSMVSISRVLMQYSKANASATRVHELLNITPTPSESRNFISSSDFAISVKHLSFSFDEVKIFEDLSFQLKRGESLGIIGQTGSGKTTLVELLTGIYDTYTGTIRINDKDIRYTDKKVLASSIGIARQKFDIFTDTIEKNIILDKPYDDETFALSIANAQIEDFINVNGKELHVRQSGTNLSGGQRQRINLARLFYNDPDILVLDDVSSALDATTNAKLNESLVALREAKTMIYISNKVSSIKNCDVIMVLEEGKITGFDTHDNLLSTNLCYQQLVSETSTEEVYIHEE